MIDAKVLEEFAIDAKDWIKHEAPPGMGVAVLAFDYGPGGTMAYACNAKRSDMVKALRELADNLERGGQS